MLLVGRATLPRASSPPSPAQAALAAGTSSAAAMSPSSSSARLQLLPWQLPLLESAALAVANNWMVLLVGGAGSGKTSLVRALAQLCGRPLSELPLTPGTDTSDLLGSFEQVEPVRRLRGAGAHADAAAAQLLQCQLLVAYGGATGGPAHAATGVQWPAALQSARAACAMHAEQMAEPGVTLSPAEAIKQVRVRVRECVCESG